jgi:DNA polymerase epsilon subunit 2
MPIPNQRKVSRAVYLIFTKKYGLHMQPDASRYLEELLRDEENVNDSLERIVKMYQKRNEGMLSQIISFIQGLIITICIG